MSVSVSELGSETYDAWIEMRGHLWEDSPEDCRKAYETYLKSRKAGRAFNLVAQNASGSALGFVEAALRSDYVEGTDTSPVWYVEGVYVAPGARRRGVGRQLIDAVTTFAGTDLLASDCELENEASRRFHESIGFKEVIRSIHFIRERGA